MRFALSFLAVAALLGLAVFDRPSTAQSGTATYKIDPAHSGAVFRVGHLGASVFWGRFNGIAGTVKVGDAGAVDITVDAASVDTANEKRDQHLKSPDFLNVKQFPAITFQSSSFRQVEGTRYEAKGTLTLHGVSKEMTVPVEHTGNGKGLDGKTDLIGFEATFEIDRTQFGMNELVGPVGKDVRLVVFVEAAKQ